MKEALKSKKGDAYIYLCVLIIFISLLLSLVILYMGLCSQIQIQKRQVQSKLDGYVSEFAIERFDEIKQGDQYLSLIDFNEFAKGAYKAIGFTDSNINTIEFENKMGYMTRPEITVLKGNGFGITVKYKAVFYLQWNGKTYSDLSVPMSVTSYYKNK